MERTVQGFSIPSFMECMEQGNGYQPNTAGVLQEVLQSRHTSSLSATPSQLLGLLKAMPQAILEYTEGANFCQQAAGALEKVPAVPQAKRLL